MIKIKDWINTKDQLPPENKNILILFKKGKKTKGGNIGTFITQVYLENEAKRLAEGPQNGNFWVNLGYGLCWFDYTSRQIQNMNAKNSANQVIYWTYLPETP